MDELVNENVEILNHYVTEVLGYAKSSNKKVLNEILDALESTYIFVTFSDWDYEYPLVKIHKILGKAMTIHG